MSKKHTKSIHVSIPKGLYDDLKKFSNDRGQSMTATLKYALETLFSVEPMESAKFNKLNRAVTALFNIPKGWLLQSFWLTLFITGKNVPKGSSKRWWGDMIYNHDEDLTNQQVIELITKKVYGQGREEENS